MYDTTRQASTLPDTSRPTLSVEETAAIFVDARVPKSIRTIQRYCRSNLLECIRTDTEFGDKYLIDRRSVDRRIDELQKFQEMMATTSVATHPDTSRPDASRHDTTRNDATRRDAADESPTKQVKELEAEVLNLKIDNRAKEIVITQLAEERKGFFSQMTEQATRIGELSTRLRQLMAPKATTKPGEGQSEEVIREVQGGTAQEGDNSQHENSGLGVEL